ncbi:hypothetical protein XFF6992_530002 [Xanthomonas citri pv. fuscans]|uniref:hypothetical protein n=1 Tax=Xanthomonas citri TaxID=346 RepID=UPI000C60665D|nr:hypothetical protein [Xanthomonas citri]QTF19455.1 hypothetical protein XcfCFBP6992P_11090 [Xanthomonas citri pv. phaseoli var. fuscans]QTF76526.1 hypothetical protein XcfCFBP6994P_19800 [Xanthomonas citri pv. phaseoli var. fuscans]QTF76741.1 hypothetical protein XcfCFBP6996P_05955 [Xanthomonas citri pv. phaseoli var. fuscans]SOO21219.1 hypothetical protein XFF6992_530002 [Xanthomonas citri pv. fuscans]SOO35282.1 hypothetical protein XFF6994_5180021 [Xanthomonas citri pv. fuscans]
MLASGYAQAFDVLRDQRVDRLGKKDMDALVERLSQGASLRDLTLHRTQAPDGTISERWQIDNDEDLRLFRKNQTWANAAEVAPWILASLFKLIPPAAPRPGPQMCCSSSPAAGSSPLFSKQLCRAANPWA